MAIQLVNTLPVDVWSLVGGFLDLDDVLYGLRLVSKSLYEVSCQDSFWESLFKAHCTEDEFEQLKLSLCGTDVFKDKIILVAAGAAGDWNRVLWSECYKWAYDHRHKEPWISGSVRFGPQPQQGIRSSRDQLSAPGVTMLDPGEENEKIGAKMVHTLMHERKSCCAIAYGALATGKSQTLFGAKSSEDPRVRQGVARRCVEVLFEKNRQMGRFSAMFIEVMEVHCETLRDLLSTGNEGVPAAAICKMKMVHNKPVVEGLTKKRVDSLEDWDASLQQALAVQAHFHADTETRASCAHLFVQTTCVPKRSRGDYDGDHRQEQTLLFCKLGGWNCGAVAGCSAKQLKEANGVAIALNSFSQVLRALKDEKRVTEKGAMAATKKEKPIIPYRNSKVTMLLQRLFLSPQDNNTKDDRPSCCSAQLHIIGTVSTSGLDEEDSTSTLKMIDYYTK